jgi:general secretion pathway protein M
MKAWFQQLEARQRLVLIGAAVILLALVLFVQVWEPLQQASDQERARIAQQQALLDWLVAVTPMAQQLQQQRIAQRRDNEQSLLVLADQSARAAGLASSLTRIEPAGQAQVRVWLDNADFLSTMGWLQQLSSRHPIDVNQMTVDRAAAEGRVNVRVTLSEDA